MKLKTTYKLITWITTLSLLIHYASIPMILASETDIATVSSELEASPTPEPTPESSPNPTPDPTLEPSPSPEPSPEPTPNPSPEPSPSPTLTPEAPLNLSPEPPPTVEDLLSTLATASAEPTPSPLPLPLSSFDASQSAEITEVATTSAITGVNIATGSGTATMNTGDATAIANIVNAINTNAINSQLAFIAITPKVDESGNIDLNELWQQITELNESLINSSSAEYPLKLTLFNAADVSTLVVVNADTGTNNLTSDAVDLTTGNALAIANVGQLINTNLFNAQVLFSIINILPGFTGNIILPRPPTTLPGGEAALLTTTSTASSSSQLVSDANTGTNTSNGTTSTSTTTGDAHALGSVVSYLDTMIVNGALFSFLINNITGNPVTVEGWTHDIYNNVLQWLTPSTAENTSTAGSQTNHATVNTFIQAIANTGNNKLTGSTTNLTTGTSKAIASLVEFTNTTVINGKLFSGIANIAGNWFGKIIIAHPDVTITTTPVYTQAEPGSEISFNLQLSNVGHDLARYPTVTFTLPDQVSYLGSTCNYPATVVGSTVTWQLPTLAKNTQVSCVVTGKVNEKFNFSTPQQTAFSLVKPVYAASHTTTLTAFAKIQTIDPELNTTNNVSQGQFTVHQLTDDISDNTPSDLTQQESSSSEFDHTQPKLVIYAENNVNDYVYTGDTVTFFIQVANTGNGTAKNSKLFQTLYGPSGESLGTASFSLGTIAANQGGKLTFGITLPKDFVTGTYTTRARAFTESDNGISFSSNETTTTFRLIGQPTVRTTSIGTTSPTDTLVEPAILGAMATPVCELPFNPLPYVIIVGLSGLWLVWARRHLLTSVPTTILFILTSTTMMVATVYAVYTLGIHYRIFPTVPLIEKLTMAISAYV